MSEKKETVEKLLYIYRCNECGKFYETDCRQDALVCSCGKQCSMSTPEYTIKHYKKTRMFNNVMTIVFSMILPIITLCLFMFVRDSGPESTAPEALSYKLPLLAIVLCGTVVLKARPLLDRAIANTTIAPVRIILVFINKTILFVLIIAVLSVFAVAIDKVIDSVNDIVEALEKIKSSLLNTIAAVGIVVVEIGVAYCYFDVQYSKADYIIQRAMRQSETIQAMEMSGR